MIGEVFEDGQFRGSAQKVELKHNTELRIAMHIGDYMLFVMPTDPDLIGVSYLPTGEMGVFKKKDLEPHLAAFFGLNF
jgi:hypothetical protein